MAWKDPEKLKKWRLANTVISIRKGTRSDLEEMGFRNDTYDFLLSRLIKYANLDEDGWWKFLKEEREKREQRKAERKSIKYPK